jgi:hypothetical protein
VTPARRGPARPAALAIALVLLAGLALVACGGPAPVPATGGPAASEPLTSPVIGRLVRLEAEGLTKVRGFTMRLADGREVAFTMGPVDNAAEFPPGHLAEHMASSQLVRVFYREEAGTRVVYRLEDGE